MLSSKSKVFVIGHGKTGTSSLGAAMEVLGYRRFGWTPASREMITRWHEGRLWGSDLLKTTLRDYESFDDFPWGLIYRELAMEFPDAKFILTVRRSPEVWLKSLQKHHLRRNKKALPLYLIYGSYDPVADGEIFVRSYENHNRDVDEFFSEPGRPKLITMCLDEGDGFEKLCGFLGQPIVNRPFPHANPAPR